VSDEAEKLESGKGPPYEAPTGSHGGASKKKNKKKKTELRPINL